jgi:hypothetical protein
LVRWLAERVVVCKSIHTWFAGVPHGLRDWSGFQDCFEGIFRFVGLDTHSSISAGALSAYMEQFWPSELPSVVAAAPVAHAHHRQHVENGTTFAPGPRSQESGAARPRVRELVEIFESKRSGGGGAPASLSSIGEAVHDGEPLLPLGGEDSGGDRARMLAEMELALHRMSLDGEQIASSRVQSADSSQSSSSDDDDDAGNGAESTHLHEAHGKDVPTAAVALVTAPKVERAHDAALDLGVWSSEAIELVRSPVLSHAAVVRAQESSVAHAALERDERDDTSAATAVGVPMENTDSAARVGGSAIVVPDNGGHTPAGALVGVGAPPADDVHSRTTAILSIRRPTEGARDVRADAARPATGITESARAIFSRLDRNGDGAVSRAELIRALRENVDLAELFGECGGV